MSEKRRDVEPVASPGRASPGRGSLIGGSLRADCTRCVGLCCVAPAFSASAEFAVDKPAGRACPNLRPDFRCGIHDSLRQRGFAGCASYDCFGAGQHVTQVTFGGRDWRRAPQAARQMFEVFAVVRQLHELLWHLAEAVTLPAARPLRPALRRALDETDRLRHRAPETIVQLDVAAHRRGVTALLRRSSELARARVPGRKPDRSGADLSGADRSGADLAGAGLQGADLRGASLRGAYLIGADLRGADLRVADLAGADLRGADLRRADLRGCLFLTQSQLDAAGGDGRTRLPASLSRPSHWG